MRETTAKQNAPLNFVNSEAIVSGVWRVKLGHILFVGVVSMVILLLARSTAFAADANREYYLKAAFLYNICKFVEWPSERFPNVDSPLVIGVLGTNPFDDQLENLLKNHKINGHSIVIKQVTTIDTARATHVLFIATSEVARFTAMRAELASGAVLTVGESRTFLEGGGIFSIVPAADRLSFEINMSAADQAHLKVSAQLQKLAITVLRP